MKLTARQFLLLFKESKTEEEFNIRCAMLGLKPEAMMHMLVEQVKSYWQGQWQNGAEYEDVTIHKFFAEKARVREAANISMTNLVSAIVTFVSYGV